MEENLEGSRWVSQKYNRQVHQVIFVEMSSLYVLANIETGIASCDLCFDDYDELAEELRNGWDKIE
jgi:hypothetical protein